MATAKQEQLYNEIIEYYNFAEKLVKIVENSTDEIAEQQFDIIEEAIQKFLQDKKLKGDKRSEEELREEGELSDGNDIQTLRDKVADHNNLLKDILRKINETSTFSESVKDDLAAEVFQMHLMTLPPLVDWLLEKLQH